MSARRRVRRHCDFADPRVCRKGVRSGDIRGRRVHTSRGSMYVHKVIRCEREVHFIDWQDKLGVLSLWTRRLEVEFTVTGVSAKCTTAVKFFDSGVGRCTSTTTLRIMMRLAFMSMKIRFFIEARLAH